MSLLSPPDVSSDVNPPIPAFLGHSGGVGLVGELFWRDFIGFESGLWRVSSEGQGKFTFLGADSTLSVEQTLSATEMHIPLLLKVQVPDWKVSPFLGFGVTWVIQTETSYEISNSDVTTAINAPEQMSYATLTTQIGATVEVGEFSLPLELRALYHPLDREPEARASFQYYETEDGLFLTDLSVDAVWDLQLWIMVGVQFEGDLK